MTEAATYLGVTACQPQYFNAKVGDSEWRGKHEYKITRIDMVITDGPPGFNYHIYVRPRSEFIRADDLV